MMRSTSKQRPCAACNVPTRFERDVVGPRGGLIRKEPCCVPCGEYGRQAKAAA